MMAATERNNDTSVGDDASHANYMAAFIIGFCIFTTGGCGLVMQYVIATATTYSLGNSIVVFSLVIAIMLGAMGIGGIIQDWLSEDRLLEKFFAVEVSLALLGGFAPTVLFIAYGAAPDHFNLVLYSWCGAIGLLIGLEIPIAMRIVQQNGIKLRSNLKHVLSADYLGAFLFALVWVLYLLPQVITETSLQVALLNYVVALVAVLYFGTRGDFMYKRTVGIVSVVVLAILVWGYQNNRDWNTMFEQRLYDDPVVYKTTTRYQHLVVTRAEKTRCGEEIRLYINGNTQFGSCDEDVYHDNLVAPTMTLAEQVDSVLILGGGDGLALRDVLRYDPQSVTLVDLDDGMLAIARDNEYLRRINQGAFDDARVTAFSSPGVWHYAGEQDFSSVEVDTGEVNSETGQPITETVAQIRMMNIDAGKFLEQTNESYDAIIVDLPDPNSVELSRLYTKRFYDDLRRRLRPGGVITVQSTSPTHAREVYLEIGRTMAAAGLETIPYHDNVASFGDWGYWMACGHYGCADELREQIASLDAFGVKTSYLTPDRLRANLTFGQVDGVPFLESAEGDQVNTTTNPTLYQRYEKAWKSY